MALCRHWLVRRLPSARFSGSGVSGRVFDPAIELPSIGLKSGRRYAENLGFCSGGALSQISRTILPNFAPAAKRA
jgi:hypothetical protein